MSGTRGMRRGHVYMATYTFPHERQRAGTAGTEKQRPVLVLQHDEDNENERYPVVLAAPITTQKVDRIYPQDVLVSAGESGLHQDSKLLLGPTQPFLKVRLSRHVGRLSPAKMREVDLKLLRLLGFMRGA